MSRIILLIIGFVAGWFLKDSNWQEWLDSLKTPQQAPQKPISLLTEETAEPVRIPVKSSTDSGLCRPL